MKKRIVSLLLALVMVVGLIPAVAYATENVPSDWPSFRGNAQNNGVTSAQTPRSAEETELKWAAQHSTGWSDAPSPMLLVDNSLVSMYGSTLKKLSLENGEVLASAEMAAATSYGSVPPTYGDGIIFCPLKNGTVQAFDAKTLEALWTFSDDLGGQAQSPIAYADGKIYVGFGYNKESAFVCLSAEDGSLVWRETDSKGFYWAGAVVVGDYVICGNENGHLVSRNKNTGELVTDLTAGSSVIHSTISYDNGKVYFTMKDATLCRADLNMATGELSNLTTKDCSEYGAGSTSTPVVYGGLVYFGVGDWSGSKNVVCLDADTLEVKWTVEEPAYPQCSILLSTAYADSGYVYLYVTYNSEPGGINVIKAKTDGSEATQETLWDAAGYKQYCICSVIAGSDGTLYYKNDSGNVFALSMTKEAKDELEQEATDRAAAKAVTEKINAIGTVTLSSEDAIEAARDAYDDLTEAQKALVSNYEALTAAEARLEELKNNPAAPGDVYVTISNAGEVVVAQKQVTVSDYNGNGYLDVDDALWYAHEAAYPGGAAAGYASERGQWGLSISMLWGDTSYAFGYWLNNASCWSLEDAVQDGDHLVAFVYRDSFYYTDVYTRFDQFTYTTETESALTVTLEKAGYDENWNTVFAAWPGAKITVSDAEGNAVDSYTLTDNGDGTYAITFRNEGTYCLTANSESETVVPAVCEVTVTAKTEQNPGENPDGPEGSSDTGDGMNLILPFLGLFTGLAGLGVAALTSKKKHF